MSYLRKWGVIFGENWRQCMCLTKIVTSEKEEILGMVLLASTFFFFLFLVGKMWLVVDNAALPLACDGRFSFLYFQVLKHRYALPLCPDWWGSVFLWCFQCLVSFGRKEDFIFEPWRWLPIHKTCVRVYRCVFIHTCIHIHTHTAYRHTKASPQILPPFIWITSCPVSGMFLSSTTSIEFYEYGIRLCDGRSLNTSLCYYRLSLNVCAFLCALKWLRPDASARDVTLMQFRGAYGKRKIIMTVTDLKSK